VGIASTNRVSTATGPPDGLPPQRFLAVVPVAVGACRPEDSALSVIASPCRPGIAWEDGGSKFTDPNDLRSMCMSTADLLGDITPEPAMPTDETTKHFYRVAGLGGVGAFLAWLGQPVLVFLISGPQGEAGADWSEIEGSRYNGAFEVLVFAAIGVGLLFMVLGTWRIIGRRKPEASLAATTGQVMGLVAAASWFLVAAESFRMYTSVGAAIPIVTDDSHLQASIIQGTGLDITGALLLFAVGYTGWVAMVATAGRRAGVVGMPIVGVLALSVLAWVPALVVPFSMPWPMVGFLGTMLILGISFLVRSRR
jgi:hypothetical protein